ncbi:MAG: hypothetical protein JWN70_6043 [Planctomycetaceae bacterium]|nr:hypothetical protein [Planctomycetaceae bacterium]
MEAVLAMAPPMSLSERLVVACFGFALACTLARLMIGTTLTTVRMLFSLCVVLALVLGSSLLADDRSVLAFLAGVLGGAIAVPNSVNTIAPSCRRSWGLPVACLVSGPVLGIVLFVATQLTTDISPLDRLYYFRVFITVGSLAGLLSAGVVSIIVSRAVRRSA